MSPSTDTLDVKPLSRLFKALADETRLRMVALLSHGDLCVCHVEEALGLPQSTASRQLAILKSAGLVESRRQGTWMYYGLLQQTDADCEKVLQTLCETFVRQEQLHDDVVRLSQIRGPLPCP
jgi:ArsR family transcriptional regulator, arsenate/arsenite/antimonite-responsive transcriptional repressor